MLQTERCVGRADRLGRGVQEACHVHYHAAQATLNCSSMPDFPLEDLQLASGYAMCLAFDLQLVSHGGYAMCLTFP